MMCLITNLTPIQQWLSLSMNNVDYQEDHVLDSLSSVFYEAGSKGLYPSFTDIHTAVMEWERAHPNELSHFPPQLPINVSAANFTSDGSHPATDLPPDFSADKVHVGKFTNQTQISSSSHTSSAEDVVWSSPFPVRKGASVNNNGAQCEEVDTSPILLADETTKLTSVLTQLSPPGRSHELNDANETTEQTSSVPDLHEDAMATQVKPMIEDFTYVNTDKVLSTAESSGAESQDVTQTPHEDMVQDNNRTTQDAASTLMVEDFEQMTGEHFEQKMGEFSEQTTGEVSEQTMTQDIVQDAEQMTIEDSEQRTRDAGGIMMAIGDGEQVMMHEDLELTTFKDVAHMTMRYDAEPPTDENIEGEDGDVRDDDGRPVEDAMQYKRITRRQAQNQRRNLSTRPTEHVEDDAADEVNYVTEEDAKPLQTKTRKKTKSAGLSRTKWNARATVKQKPTEPISRKELRISDEDLVTAPYPCFHCFSSSSTCRIGAGSTAMKRACNRCTIRKQSCSFNMNSALIKQRHEPNSVHARAIPYIAMLFGGNVPQTTPEVQRKCSFRSSFEGKNHIRPFRCRDKHSPQRCKRSQRTGQRNEVPTGYARCLCGASRQGEWTSLGKSGKFTDGVPFRRYEYAC